MAEGGFYQTNSLTLSLISHFCKQPIYTCCVHWLLHLQASESCSKSSIQERTWIWSSTNDNLPQCTGCTSYFSRSASSQDMIPLLLFQVWDKNNNGAHTLLLGNLASEQPTGAQKGLMERQEVRGDYHSLTREGQQELDRVLLVFSIYLYKEKY